MFPETELCNMHEKEGKGRREREKGVLSRMRATLFLPLTVVIFFSLSLSSFDLIPCS